MCDLTSNMYSTELRKLRFTLLAITSLLFLNFVFDGNIYFRMNMYMNEVVKMEDRRMSTMQLQDKIIMTEQETRMLKMLVNRLIREKSKSKLSRTRRSTNDKNIETDRVYAIGISKKWLNNQSVVCLSCPRGEKGEMGDKGKAGLMGALGPVGPRGTKGKTGKSGPKGSEGSIGPIGIAGLPGPQGPRGKDGPRGLRGIKGPKGDPGESIHAPIISSPPTFTEVLSGKNATFYCGTKGNPTPEIEWKVNDKSLVPRQFHYRHRGDLVINTESFSGGNTKISCNAKNILGRASDSAVLSVLVKPSTSISPEHFVSIRGTEVTIKCIATGFPTPEISWSKDDGNLPQSARKLENGRTLMIPKSNTGDSGRYTCKATNKVGSSLASSLIIVRDGKSCNDVWRNGHRKNGVYNIEKTGLVYCHMVSIPGCGDGGWTQVIKMDGNKDTFKFNSPLWTNKMTHKGNICQGIMGNSEIKTTAYWTIPFEKVCIGMKVGKDLKWIRIQLQLRSSSLYDVIADGTYRSTNLGRQTWKSLISGSSLQLNCNREGFNVNTAAQQLRIGIASNQENHCNSCDSAIGFGRTGWYGKESCGNTAGSTGGDNGKKNIAAWGYIFVQ